MVSKSQDSEKECFYISSFYLSLKHEKEIANYFPQK